MSSSQLPLPHSPDSSSYITTQHSTPAQHPSNSQPLSPPLDAIFKRLSARLAQFENDLNQVVQEENQFRSAFIEQADSLHTIVQRYAQEDENLARLVEEDTQRSRDAQAEYEALEKDFDENVRPNSPTRIWNWLSTVCTNLWILLSLIFMAPVHAVWLIVEKLLTKTGIIRTNHLDPHRSYASLAIREERLSRSNRENKNRKPAKSNTSQDGLVVTHWVHSNQQRTKSRRRKSTVDNIHNTPKDDITTSSTTAPTNVPPQTYASTSDANLSTPTLVIPKHIEDQLIAMSNTRKDSEMEDSDDAFVDAQSYVNQSSQNLSSPIIRENTIEEELSSPDVTEVTSDPESHRPAWAQVNESAHILPDIEQFPSGEFWEISDDEMKLELKR